MSTRVIHKYGKAFVRNDVHSYRYSKENVLKLILNLNWFYKQMRIQDEYFNENQDYNFSRVARKLYLK